MDIIYMSLLLIIMAVMAACIVVAGRKKNNCSGEIMRLLATAIGASFFYILFLQMQSEVLATLFDGLYFVGTDWMVLCMLAYVMKYTETSERIRRLRWLFLAFVVLDSVSLAANAFAGHMFALERAVYNDSGLLYWSAEFFPLHYWHLGLCYAMALLILAILVFKIILSPKQYRKMYAYTLTAFGIVIAINAVCYTMDLPYDFSLLFYALLALFICYFTIYATPKGLVTDTMVSVVEDINNGIVCFDLRGKCVYANSKAREMLKIDGRSGDDKAEEHYRSILKKHPIPAGDYEQWEEISETDGEERHQRVEFQRLKDERENDTGYFYKITDITDEIRRFREEQYMATHDRLTGLYNREYFFRKAAEILKMDPLTERYMVCTNISNFKLINDLFGTEMGDRVLIDQAKQLNYANYENCIKGRIAADRFAMLIAKENFDPEMAVENTGKLQYLIGNSNYKINICIGVYKITDPEESPQVMYDKANMAIKSAHGDYQKTVCYYDAKMLEQMVSEKNVINEFDSALRNRQFSMYLQPQVDVDGRLLGAEALARWQHPEKGLMFPISFMSVIEKSGLIIKLDQYMWELAAAKLRDWKERGREDLCISVNISAKDFYYEDLYELFTQLVKKYGIQPENLKLEITETVLMSDLELHLKTLGKLQKEGFSIEIDDFGSGYSSLNMLKDINADILKIDMLFLQENKNKEKSRTILRSIISMAKALEMQVICEGVETEEQAAYLAEMGCNAFQGYFFSKPIPVEEFENKYLK